MSASSWFQTATSSTSEEPEYDLHGGAYAREYERGEHAEERDQGDQDGHGQALVPVHVLEVRGVYLVGQRAEHRPLEGPEIVRRSYRDAQDRNEQPQGPLVEHGREDHELGREADQAGQAQGCQETDGHERGDYRHLLREATEAGYHPRAALGLHAAAHHNQDSRHEPVGEHLEHARDHTELRERGEAEQDEAHVADRGVRDHLLEVLLREAEHRPVQYAGDGNHGHHWDHVLRAGRERRYSDPYQAVPAHLQQQPGKQDAPRGRGLDMRVRQPRVEGHHRELDAEPEEQRREYPDLPPPAEIDALGGYGRHAERAHARLEVHRHDGDEHREARDMCVYEELDRRVVLVRSAPAADHEVHRYQDDLPEHVEHEVVQR